MSIFLSICLVGAIGGPIKIHSVDDLKWMVGNWKAEIWGGEFHETWLEPSGGTIQGLGRHLKAGKVGFMEFMSIESTEKGLAMFMVLGKPSEGLSKPVPFYLLKMEGKSATWQRDDKGDFPKRIIYKAKPDGSMDCRIEDDTKHEEFPFKKR